MRRTLAPRADKLAHITTLQILITSMRDIERTAWVLKQTPALQGLDLEETLSRLESHTHSRFEIDAECFKGLFTSCGNACNSARLKSLRIVSTCLGESGELLPIALNLEGLETLQLVECNETGSFIERLTQPRLHVFLSTSTEEVRDPATIRQSRISLLPWLHQNVSPFFAKWTALYAGQIDLESLQDLAQSMEYLRLEDNNATYRSTLRTPY